MPAGGRFPPAAAAFPPAGTAAPADPAAGRGPSAARCKRAAVPGPWRSANRQGPMTPSMLASTGQPDKLGKMDFIFGFCRICQRNEL